MYQVSSHMPDSRLHVDAADEEKGKIPAVHGRDRPATVGPGGEGHIRNVGRCPTISPVGAGPACFYWTAAAPEKRETGEDTSPRTSCCYAYDQVSHTRASHLGIQDITEGITNEVPTQHK